MSDYISRQAAIDVARKCPVKEVTPAYRLIDKAEVMTELAMLPSAQPEQRWIPCSEKLPDTYLHDEIGIMGEKVGEFRLSKPVLGYTPSEEGDMQVVWYEDDLDGRTGWQTVPDCADVNVIAWMPLPEPYREEEE